MIPDPDAAVTRRWPARPAEPGLRQHSTDGEPTDERPEFRTHPITPHGPEDPR
ncbi:hypothetical protein ACIQBJ_02300 [Kitasatospora sp. NPDC088391]|uniref:hypothetical protein n=1 Tax=Kitasatospora sp. NPDC088391 TaxID=3364074 RepID=UPI0038031D4A